MRSRGRRVPDFVYIVAMAQISHLSSIAILHGKTARAGAFAIAAIKTITLKTITKS
jgi:hypothetical protein